MLSSSWKYVEPTNQNLICCICRAPFTDPVTSRSCLHTFCKACISQALEHSGLCPIDRCSLSKNSLIQADPIIRSLVDELLVECPDCSSTLQRHRLSHHRANDCDGTSVRCPDSLCDQTVLRKELKGLEGNACPHRSKTCAGCQESMLLSELEFHQPKCLLRVTTCTSCGESLPRSELRAHTDSCPEVIVHCRQSVHGCPWTEPRCLLDSHLEKCPFNAIAPFFALNDARFNKVEEEKVELQRKVNALEGLLNVMRNEMQALHDSLGPWFSPINSTSYVAQSSDYLFTEAQSATSSSQRVSSSTAGASDSSGQDISSPRTPSADPSSSTLALPQASPSTTQVPLHAIFNDLATSVRSLSQSMTTLSNQTDALNRRVELSELAMSNETLRLGEEIVALRTGIHGLRMQVHGLLVDRSRFQAANGEAILEESSNMGIHPPLLRAPNIQSPFQFAYGGYPTFGVGGPGNVKL